MVEIRTQTSHLAVIWSGLAQWTKLYLVKSYEVIYVTPLLLRVLYSIAKFIHVDMLSLFNVHTKMYTISFCKLRKSLYFRNTRAYYI